MRPSNDKALVGGTPGPALRTPAARPRDAHAEDDARPPHQRQRLDFDDGATTEGDTLTPGDARTEESADDDDSSLEGSPATRAVEALRIEALPQAAERDAEGVRDAYFRRLGDQLADGIGQRNIGLNTIGEVLAALAQIHGEDMSRLFDPNTWDGWSE
jgi:hypothetical protein|tara:strand:- start:4904 stop:5377 length:474 start_codon:yes stop_codon:yes gene_type:complete